MKAKSEKVAELWSRINMGNHANTCVFEQGLHIHILSCSNFHIVCANDVVPFSINKHGHTRWPSNLKTVCDSYVLKGVLQWDYCKSCERSDATTLEPTFPVKFIEMNQKTVNWSAQRSCTSNTTASICQRKFSCHRCPPPHHQKSTFHRGFPFAQGFPLQHVNMLESIIELLCICTNIHKLVVLKKCPTMHMCNTQKAFSHTLSFCHLTFFPLVTERLPIVLRQGSAEGNTN